jgi:hypothetical protein
MNWRLLDRMYSLVWAAAVLWFMALLVRKLLFHGPLGAREFEILLAAGLLTIVYCAIRFIALKHHAHDHAGPLPAGAARRGMTRSQL